MEAEAAPSAKIKEPGFFYNFDATILVAVLFAIGFAITWVTVGPNEALRGFAAEAVILAAVFAVARQYLPWEDAPKARIKRHKTELAIGLLAYAAWIIGAVVLFRGGSAGLWLALGVVLPVAVLLVGRYSSQAWGLRMPRGRDWLVLAVVALINYGLSWLFDRLLPPGELAEPASAALAQHAIGGSLLVSLVVAAVLEEFFFRVYLQPRLGAYLPGRWAAFTQAVMFSAAYLPLYLIGNGYSLAYSLALVMVLTNGIVAGYFWRKTGSLPLLILLHLLAFSRFAL